MTALQSTFAPSFHGHGPFDTMPDQIADNQDWQNQHQHGHHPNTYIPHMPMLTNQWAPQSQPQSNTPQHQQQQILGMAGMNRRYFQDDAPSFMAFSSTNPSNNLISPCFPAENAWSDIDMNTPSNFDSPQEPIESFIPNQSTPIHLQPPQLPSNTRHSHAHAPITSPHQDQTDQMSVDRPGMPGRSQTEPVKSHHHGRASKTANIKASGSDDSDEDFVPSEANQSSKTSNPVASNTNNTSNRGRKRQRIPHTAVERRYRENLNAHLERLRQTVPSLATRRTPSGISLVGTNASGHRVSEPNTAPVVALLSDGAKPSKCEILNGAIEHIGTVERENGALREEVKDLRARVEDLQRWYSATLQSAGGGRVGGYAG